MPIKKKSEKRCCGHLPRTQGALKRTKNTRWHVWLSSVEETGMHSVCIEFGIIVSQKVDDHVELIIASFVSYSEYGVIVSL
jgi:hypothetical protein